MYISKGTVISPSTEGLLFVVRGGVKFQLTGQEAALWLNGRFQFVDEKTEDERRCLKKLKRMSLAETSQSQSEAEKYRILTQCVLYPAVPKRIRHHTTKKEREMLDWLMKAGLHLTVAELVCLNEKGISPTEDLLYSYNRQALTEAIYLDHSIQDNVLEAQMEHSPARDVTVATILSLLRKKRILLL